MLAHGSRQGRCPPHDRSSPESGNPSVTLLCRKPPRRRERLPAAHAPGSRREPMGDSHCDKNRNIARLDCAPPARILAEAGAVADWEGDRSGAERAAR